MINNPSTTTIESHFEYCVPELVFGPFNKSSFYNQKRGDTNVLIDWKGDSLGSANRIFKYEDELFDIEESDQMLKHLIEQMDVQECLDVLHDWGAEDID